MITKEKNHVVAWKNKATGKTGQGVRKLTKAEAEQSAGRLNQQIPGMEHFAKKVSENDKIEIDKRFCV